MASADTTRADLSPMKVAAVVAAVASGHSLERVARHFGLSVETVQGFLGYQVTGTRPSSQKVPAKCGTPSGYKRHKRAGHDACADCKRAHSQYVEDYKRKRMGR